MNIIKSANFYLVLIVLLALVLRLYKVDSPIADWHSWRQADTAAVSRHFFQDGYNPLMPKYDDMSGVAENPVPNPERHRFVEFPIYNSLVFFLYKINGAVDEKLARLTSVAFSLGSIIFLYLISRRYLSLKQSLLVAFTFAVLPFNVFYSRVVLPEPTLVFFCLGMFYFVDNWLDKDTKKWFVLSIVFTACAFLLKPFAIFYLLPLLYKAFSKGITKKFILYLGLSLLPFILWRVWMSQFPEGIPASNWLFDGNNLRFKPSFWKWIVSERIGREILAFTGGFLFFLGLIRKHTEKEGVMLHLLMASLILYLIVFATGNVQHDYYQVLIVPGLVIFLVRGLTFLGEGSKNLISRLWTIPLGILFFVLTFYLSFQEVKGLYQVNNGIIVEAGRRADQVLPKEAVVVAPYNGDTAFLYHINRPGFPFILYPIPVLVKDYGVTHYVSVNYDDPTNELMKKYKIVEQTPKYIILDLRVSTEKFLSTSI